MSESISTTPSEVRPTLAWAERPTIAQRTAAQQAVARLFDILAPQRPPGRRDEQAPATLRHRSPTGCILQGPERAVTVSWFADSVNDLTLGELQLITWDGQVARPGAPRRPGAGATTVTQETFTPVDGGAGKGWIWRDAAGVTYDAEALAARCHTLLDERAAA